MAVVMCIAVVVIVFLFAVNSVGSRQLNFATKVLPVLTPVMAGLTLLAGGFWVFHRFRKKADERGAVFNSAFFFTVSASLLGLCLVYNRVYRITPMIIAIIAGTVLYCVYFLYDRLFFAYTAYAVYGGIVLLGYGSSILVDLLPIPQSVLLVVYTALTVIITIAAASVFALAAKNGGAVKLGKRKLNLSGDISRTYPFIINSGLILIGAVLAPVFPGTVNYTAAAVLISYLVIAIIQTVKMM